MPTANQAESRYGRLRRATILMRGGYVCAARSAFFDNPRGGADCHGLARSGGHGDEGSATACSCMVRSGRQEPRFGGVLAAIAISGYGRAMPNDLYEHDVLAWSERQAELLRRVARGERVTDIDWDHVVEEIEDA